MLKMVINLLLSVRACLGLVSRAYHGAPEDGEPRGSINPPSNPDRSGVFQWVIEAMLSLL
jgi:hypothetical protein